MIRSLVFAVVGAVHLALAAPAAANLVGTWRGQTQGEPVELRLEADGRGSFNGEPFQYAVMGDQLLVNAEGEIAVYQFQLKGESLTVVGGTLAAPLQLSRAGTAAKPAARAASPDPAAQRGAAGQGGQGGVRQELVGKWCYFGSFSALSGGGSASSECFVLHANGSYEYSAESSMSAYSSGAYAGTASQSSDRGRWSATEQTITARSDSGTTTTYRLRKVNHPRNRDPMLCIDERCFATYYQRAPW